VLERSDSLLSWAPNCVARASRIALWLGSTSASVQAGVGDRGSRRARERHLLTAPAPRGLIKLHHGSDTLARTLEQSVDSFANRQRQFALPVEPWLALRRQIVSRGPPVRVGGHSWAAAVARGAAVSKGARPLNR